MIPAEQLTFASIICQNSFSLSPFSYLCIAMRFIYIYDPLCGWCYGFTPVIQQLQERNNGNMEFNILSGGMITGDNRHPFSSMAAYIQREHTNVEAMTGVKFGQAFLEKLLPSEEIMDSENPALPSPYLNNTSRKMLSPLHMICR